jgi:protein-L-isoaspartate(D-aspartate) O-methyltransferase
MQTVDAAGSDAPEKPPVADDNRGAGLDAAGLLALTGMVDLPLARSWMCEQLRAANVSHHVLSAMAAVPRHCFAPASRWRVAYVDLDLWTGVTWMTSPRTVARALDAVPRAPGTRVLEIGTGTGYQTALLAHMRADVTTVDVSWACARLAAERLAALGARRVVAVVGDGFAPRAFSAPLDAVVVNAALPAVPAQLFELLAPSGVVVAPVSAAGGGQRLLRCSVSAAGAGRILDLGHCSVPPIALGAGVAAAYDSIAPQLAVEVDDVV